MPMDATSPPDLSLTDGVIKSLFNAQALEQGRIYELRGRVQEFSSMATETQTTITQLIDQATAKFVDVAKKAA